MSARESATVEPLLEQWFVEDLDDVTGSATLRLLRSQRGGGVWVPLHRSGRQVEEVCIVGEIPREGAGAIARWMGLYDRAEQLRRAAALHHDPCVRREVRKAIESLFLYEHQMLPHARRQARERLWLRDHASPLPPEATREKWTLCRCQPCMGDRVGICSRQPQFPLLQESA